MNYRQSDKEYVYFDFPLFPCLKVWGGMGVLIMFFTFISIPTVAQKVDAIVSRDKIRLGEQFELRLTVAPTSNAPLNVTSWFNIPDTFAHFQVVSRKPIDTINIASTNSYQQTIILTSFDSGTFTLPSFFVFINNNKVASQEKSITVIPVDVSQQKDFNDIKDILEPEPIDNDNVVWGAFIVLVILGLCLFFYLKWMLNKKRMQGIVPIKKVSIDMALEQLNALNTLIESHQYQLFCIELMAICKSCSDYQLHITTYSKTTSEYIVLLEGKIKDKYLLQQYSHLLHWADQIKFAKSIPTVSECNKGLADAKSILTAISVATEPIKLSTDAR